MDTTAPIITLHEHQAELECGVDVYDEPGADCRDIRDQWDSANKKYVDNKLPNSGSTPGTVVGG